MNIYKKWGKRAAGKKTVKQRPKKDIIAVEGFNANTVVRKDDERVQGSR